MFPRQAASFDAAFAAAPIGTAGVADGQKLGAAVAAALLKDRGGDPSDQATGYAPSSAPGRHRVDPANPGQPYHAPFYGAASKCFAVTARHELDPPPALGTPAYEASLRQVRGKGIAPALMGTVPPRYKKRTVNQTLVGIFWAYDGPREIGTPPRLYNQIVREVATTVINPATGAVNTVDENARLFALVNAAMGDAGILAWDQKYRHDFWRPVLGIREHDPSLGPGATTSTNTINNDGDTAWLPLGAPSSNGIEPNFTPPFPAYPSGHATFGAASLHMVRLFYGVAPGDRAPDTVFKGPFVSDEHDGKTRDNTGTVRPRHLRSFPGGLWEMIEENGFSRVWLGVHWSFDAFALDGAGQPDVSQNIGGVPLGVTIAEDIFAAGGGRAPVKSAVGPRA